MQAANSTSPPLVRRIVTGHDESGQATVIFDDTEGHVMTIPNGNRFQTLWFTDEVPADLSSTPNVDPTLNKKFFAANDGSVCVIMNMKPGSKSPMHRTKTIDYAVVIEGELELELANGEKTLMKTGDVIVQRGTVHSFHNPHPNKWVKAFCVMVASNA